MALKINAREVGSAAVVDVTGEVDMHNSPELRKVLKRLVGAKKPLIVVNMSGLDYIDSSGLATLVECLQGTMKNGTKFSIFGLNPRIKNIFTLARLEQVFRICESESEAVGAAPGGKSEG
ncbi:MAG TPA: STAS domain-containing protein [Candidatus Brocadiia bacterium]|nr:STAS domain-containing protein [Candidatus Brocadiia bacterium]